MYKLYKTGKKHRTTEALRRPPDMGRAAGPGEGGGRIFHIPGPPGPKMQRAGRHGHPPAKKPQKVEALRGKQVVKKYKTWYYEL